VCGRVCVFDASGGAARWSPARPLARCLGDDEGLNSRSLAKQAKSSTAHAPIHPATCYPSALFAHALLTVALCAPRTNPVCMIMNILAAAAANSTLTCCKYISPGSCVGACCEMGKSVRGRRPIQFFAALPRQPRAHRRRARNKVPTQSTVGN
jgi:hypothetical protein